MFVAFLFRENWTEAIVYRYSRLLVWTMWPSVGLNRYIWRHWINVWHWKSKRGNLTIKMFGTTNKCNKFCKELHVLELSFEEFENYPTDLPGNTPWVTFTTPSAICYVHRNNFTVWHNPVVQTPLTPSCCLDRGEIFFYSFILLHFVKRTNEMKAMWIFPFL